MSTIKPSISVDDWNKKLNEMKVSREELDRLVMNYLVVEGYKEAAEKFTIESGLDPKVDLTSIEERMNIRKAIHSGNIDEAIDRVNDMDPEILDCNSKIYFHLQQQKLIELLKLGDTKQALSFAQDEFSVIGEDNPEFLEDLEKTMALFAFDKDVPSCLTSLLDHSQRQRTASELNAAILESQCQDRESKLPHLLKMLVFAQDQLSEKLDFPKITNFTSGEFV